MQSKACFELHTKSLEPKASRRITPLKLVVRLNCERWLLYIMYDNFYSFEIELQMSNKHKDSNLPHI